MSLAEVSTIRCIEIAYVDGAPSNLYRESRRVVLKDGVEIAANSIREVMEAGSEEAKAVLGDTLAGALAQVKLLMAQVESDNNTINALLEEVRHLGDQIAQAKARVPELEAAVDTATD
ncbi:hypothetical protein [Geothrix sp. PMB-07]|uniref:hypothetical protein n=1 Tax=Geothrix sp. PMB-07 TaxID=3068640 RepID=UPI00274145F1|nr:hypothetical protein [Geothrix sp. PMB-07]WLT32831.1 hypothetical protein Q9293_05735 [Geothrix sp. PMB-07]